MDVMGWSQVTMTTRYQHITTELTAAIADQLGGLFWADPETSEEGDDDGTTGALVPA